MQNAEFNYPKFAELIVGMLSAVYANRKGDLENDKLDGALYGIANAQVPLTEEQFQTLSSQVITHVKAKHGSADIFEFSASVLAIEIYKLHDPRISDLLDTERMQVLIASAKKTAQEVADRFHVTH